MNFKQWILQRCVDAVFAIWPNEFAVLVKDAIAPNGEVSQAFLDAVIAATEALPAPE